MRLKQCRSTKISQLVPAYHNLVVEQLKQVKRHLVWANTPVTDTLLFEYLLSPC